MGLLDKIKDNAKTISMKAIEATREYDEDYTEVEKAVGSNSSTTPASTSVAAPAPSTASEPASVTPAEEQMSYEDTDPKTEVASDKDADKPAEDKSEESKPVSRKSKVTEVSKKDIEEAEKLKKQEKDKQAAKERLAKSYTPSYKKTETAPNKKIAVEDKDDDKEIAPKVEAPKAKRKAIVDIATGKPQDNVKQAIYARERAALNAISSQRRLNGTVPLYTTSHMNFKTRVFIDRIEYSGSFGKSNLPIDQVAWIKLRYGGTGVIIETTESKRVVMVVKKADRLEFADAVMKVQSLQPKKNKFKDTKTVRIDQLEKFGQGVDEIEKLAKLFDKGIITQEEFDSKKKQILGL